MKGINRMSEVVFNVKDQKPDDLSLAERLGPSYPYWKEIRTHTSENFDPITEEWKFYGAKYGWQLKTYLKKRNLFFLIPYDSCFKIGFIFGDKAVDAVESSSVAENLKSELRNAKKYAEGRGLAIEIKDGRSIPDIMTLLEIKIKN